MDKRSHTLEKAGLAIPQILADSQLLTTYKLFQAKQHWATIAGPQIAKYSFIQDFQNNVVTIGVLNPVWMNHLFMYKQNIIRNINNHIKEQAVRDIRFVRSGRKPPAIVYETVQGTEDGHVPSVSIQQTRLPDDLVKTIRDETKSLPEGIRERVAQLRFTQAKRQIAYAQSGFHQCPRCGRWIPPEEKICFLCRLQRRQEQKQRLHDVLEHMPWLSWQEVLEEGYVPADTKAYAALYQEVRRDFIYKYIQKIHHNADTLADDFVLAMLITRKKPTDLSADFIQRLADKYRPKEPSATDGKMFCQNKPK